jgi:hypothetical protein
MIVINSILLGLVALICFLGGLNIMLKGAMSFLPKDMPKQLVLDNLVRFLSGIYFGAGFLFAYSALNLTEMDGIIYFLGLAVCLSGIGRFYSRVKVGSAGRYFDIIMIVEIILGLAIMTLKYLG